jgi:hypothetical protein
MPSMKNPYGDVVGPYQEGLGPVTGPYAGYDPDAELLDKALKDMPVPDTRGIAAKKFLPLAMGKVQPLSREANRLLEVAREYVPKYIREFVDNHAKTIRLAVDEPNLTPNNYALGTYYYRGVTDNRLPPHPLGPLATVSQKRSLESGNNPAAVLAHEVYGHGLQHLSPKRDVLKPSGANLEIGKLRDHFPGLHLNTVFTSLMKDKLEGRIKPGNYGYNLYNYGMHMFGKPNEMLPTYIESFFPQGRARMEKGLGRLFDVSPNFDELLRKFTLYP